MTRLVKEHVPPPSWAEFKKNARHPILLPFYGITWATEWAAYRLGSWALVAFLEYIGSFSILFVAIFYFIGAPDRLKQMHYQAWQVINSASGKSGNGGRIDALQELNHDRVSLVGVGVANAYLQGIQLEKASARRADFSASDLRRANFKSASLEDSNFHSSNLRGASLRAASLSGSDFDDADLTGADLTGADLDQLTLSQADLSRANLDHVKNWQSIKTMGKANIYGVQNAPAGFVEWAKKMGAVETKSD